MYKKIRELADIPSLSKHEQIVNGVINAINEKFLSIGDPLPSINAMKKETGFAIQTIVKAYNELKERGIIESRNRLGYFVLNENTDNILTVALMMYGFDTFQVQFYKSFRSELGDNVNVDVYFHHGNINIFETILEHIRGKYGMYIISPIPHPKSAGLLQTIPLNQLIMFDRYEPIEGEFNHITQEFAQSSYNALATLIESIRKYDEIIFFYSPDGLVPAEIFQSFNKFLKDFNVNGSIRPEYKSGSIEKGKVYFTIDNSELYSLIKDSKKNNLIIGKDLGLLSHNDEPVKELLCDGITTFSTDFALMGRKVAENVLSRESVQEVLPTELIRRNSL